MTLPVVLLIIALPVIALLVVGNHRLTVSTYEVALDDLPGEFDGFIIVQLSDIHNNRFGKNQRRLMRRIEEAGPDLCAVTGDAIVAYQHGGAHAVSLLGRVASRWHTFMVTGNHEARNHGWAAVRSVLVENGVVMLDGVEEIRRGDARLQLIGLDDPLFLARAEGERFGALARRLGEVVGDSDPGVTRVLLAHRPVPSLYASFGVDVALSGHAHGGLWRIPGLGGLFAPDQGLFPKYTSGIHTLGDTSVVISRGLGHASLPRIMNPPELVVVRLVKSRGGPA